MARVDIVPAEGMDVQTGLLLSVLEDVTKEWTGELDELGEVTEEQIIWQVFPNGHSIGGLILHIADVEAFWLHQVGAGQTRSAEELALLLSEETQQYQFQWPAPPPEPLSWYLAQHQAVRERTRTLIRRVNDPEHTGVHRGTEFTLRWLLNHIISHEAYHGGQAVLLALMQTTGRQGEQIM
jgi:uncharacterized damage-inducible protein DinB